MLAVPSSTSLKSSRWQAQLQLRFAHQNARTVLAYQKHIGPLLVQRTFYPEGDVCHVYIVHPPGGIAGGDDLRLQAQLEPNSHALITTPAATKFYRTVRDHRAALKQELHVQENAALEWLPQETIIFRGAQASMATIVRLDRQSRFIGWELCCYGRPASHELFDAGNARQHLELWLDQQPVYIDHLHIDGDSKTMQARWGLSSNTTLGTLLAYPATMEDLEVARADTRFACTLLDNLLSCRLISIDGYAAKNAFIRLWQILRPRIIKRDAVLPRIWAT